MHLMQSSADFSLNVPLRICCYKFSSVSEKNLSAQFGN